MIPSQDIINKLADAVIERIASDRCCNTGNIRDALFREWSAAYVAAEAAKQQQPLVGYSVNSDRICLALRDVHDFLDTLTRYNAPPGVRHAAAHLFSQTLPAQPVTGHGHGLAGAPHQKRGMFP